MIVPPYLVGQLTCARCGEIELVVVKQRLVNPKPTRCDRCQRRTAVVRVFIDAATWPEVLQRVRFLEAVDRCHRTRIRGEA